MPNTDSVGESVTGPMVAAGAMGASPRACAQSGSALAAAASNAHGTAHPLLGVERRRDALKDERAGVTNQEVGPACDRSSRVWTATACQVPCL